MKPIFLTAEWRHLLMLNYAVEPDLLRPFIPIGTELDFFEDRTYVSLVGFRFLRTRVFGVAFPFHTDFNEINLRFYVRRKTADGWRRGVVFIRELVPRRAIAFIARIFYGEPYSAFPMRHFIEVSANGIRIQYKWCRADRWESLSGSAGGQPKPISAGSEEEFITEHYWGYTARKSGTAEYEVEHPRWNVWHCTESTFDADIATLYGERFVSSLASPPTSAFIADGSPVTVRSKTLLLPPS